MKKVRELQYMMPPNGFVGALRGLITQEILFSSARSTVVMFTSRTPDAPYGSTFEARQLYKFHWIGPRQTKISVSQETHWIGDKPWVWSNIEKAVLDGSRNAARVFVEYLAENIGIDKSSSNGKDILDNTNWRQKKHWIILKWVFLVTLIVL